MKAKKKNNIAKPISNPNRKSRRDFLKIAWKGLGIAAGLEFTGMTFYYLYDREIKSAGENKFEIGSPDEFPLNSVTAFRQGHFYLVRSKQGGFIALSIKCPHLGCSIIWDDNEKQFVCPCHSSKFDQHGDLLKPPAPRALDYYSIKLNKGLLFVDLNRKIKRNEFDSSQLTFL